MLSFISSFAVLCWVQDVLQHYWGVSFPAAFLISSSLSLVQHTLLPSFSYSLLSHPLISVSSAHPSPPLSGLSNPLYSLAILFSPVPPPPPPHTGDTQINLNMHVHINICIITPHTWSWELINFDLDEEVSSLPGKRKLQKKNCWAIGAMRAAEFCSSHAQMYVWILAGLTIWLRCLLMCF